MYRGFSVQLKEAKFSNGCYDVGMDIFNNQEASLRADINSYMQLGSDGYLDGTRIQEEWFPTVEADVFLSHSHNNKELAIAFAGWLNSEFGIISFIDSCIWGYAPDLLKEIDDEFCRNVGSPTYNYIKRNYSTSHVHMMLCMALAKMIDNTECLFFIDTPESLLISEGVSGVTASPWIYAEMQISNLIEKKLPNRLSHGFRKDSAEPIMETNRLNIRHKFELGHLKRIGYDDLVKWQEKHLSPRGHNHALDDLYALVNQNNKGGIYHG